MTAACKLALVVCALLPLAGCVTEELAVYDDAVVGEQAARRYVGEYRVEAWPGDDRPETIRVSAPDGKLRFAYSLRGKNVDLPFVLSKIPNSQQNLHLLSVPSHDDTNQANLFFIGRADDDQTHIWAVFANSRVASEHLDFQNGKTKAADVKTFLAQHADAFIAANEPQVKLSNPSR